MRMGFVIFMSLICFKLWANPIEVPEDCINRVSPCLVKTDFKSLKFKQAMLEVVMQKNSILKITQNESHMSIDVLKGRLSLQTLRSSDLSVSVNGVMVGDQSYFVERAGPTLQIFDLKKFSLSEYKIDSLNNNFPVRVKDEFLNKHDLIRFTQHYFPGVSSFKEFLASIEKKWIVEFKAQNENQTKALLRSIASVEMKAEQERKQKMQKERELKKVKNDFFFRTFQR